MKNLKRMFLKDNHRWMIVLEEDVYEHKNSNTIPVFNRMNQWKCTRGAARIHMVNWLVEAKNQRGSMSVPQSVSSDSCQEMYCTNATHPSVQADKQNFSKIQQRLLLAKSRSLNSSFESPFMFLEIKQPIAIPVFNRMKFNEGKCTFSTAAGGL